MILDREKAFHLINKYGSKVAISSAADLKIADDVITLMPFAEVWEPAQYDVNETVIYEGQPVTCLQAHDSTSNPGWTPKAAPALWRPWHARTPELALPWIQPLGAGYEYFKGEFMKYSIEESKSIIITIPIYDESGENVIGETQENDEILALVPRIFECLRDNVVHSPSDLPSAWKIYNPVDEEVQVISEEPKEESKEVPPKEVEPEPPKVTYPAWKAWDGHNSSLHQIGDIVTHKGKTWKSTAPNNHWEPGIYGWVEM